MGVGGQTHPPSADSSLPPRSARRGSGTRRRLTAEPRNVVLCSLCFHGTTSWSSNLRVRAARGPGGREEEGLKAAVSSISTYRMVFVYIKICWDGARKGEAGSLCSSEDSCSNRSQLWPASTGGQATAESGVGPRLPGGHTPRLGGAASRRTSSGPWVGCPRFFSLLSPPLPGLLACFSLTPAPQCTAQASHGAADTPCSTGLGISISTALTSQWITSTVEN